MKYENLREIYDKITTPFELLEFMDNYIQFGFYGNNNKLYDTSDLDAFELASETFWNLSSPSHTLKNGYGQCFDQVELERDWFVKNGYDCKTLYITFLVSGINSYPVHAYLAFKNHGKWYWFEHCDKANKGIHEYESLEELITDQMTKHIYFTDRFNPLDDDILDCLHIFDYKSPIYGLSKKGFQSFVMASDEVPIVE